MIILRRVTVEHFRRVRRVDLYFPQRGSVLIAGPNEAGKSALLEGIYFALYGESLACGGVRGRGGEGTGSFVRVPARGTPTDDGGARDEGGVQDLDELVSYGELRASVTVMLAIGVTELRVTRTIERGWGQRVSLVVRRLGMAEEGPMTDVGEVNERILAELGQMDGETLRNSCLIEQGGVGRLEQLGRGEREAMLRVLLDGPGLFVRLGEQFRLTEDDERTRDECRLRLMLAEVQANLPELSMRLGEMEAALDAVQVREDLAAIDVQEVEIAEQEMELEQVGLRRNELAGRRVRIGQLKKADAMLGEIIGAYDAIAEAQRELPGLEREIAELERRERDELPLLEQRVHDLSDLSRSFGTLERLAADLLAAVNRIKVLEQELKEQQEIREELSELDEQVIATRLRVELARQSQHEAEGRDRAARPQLEARLRRLAGLAERLGELSMGEERYREHLLQEDLAEENSAALSAVRRELQETESELALVETETRQRKREADALEDHWREVSIGRQLEEWRRLKGLAQGLSDAEQHVLAAHQEQEQLTLLALSARRSVTKYMGSAIACVTLFLLCGSAALLLALHSASVYATVAGLASLLLVAGAGVSVQNYRRAREEEKAADAQMQDAISRVGMMVAAREAASRVAGGTANGMGEHGGSGRSYSKVLEQVEHEISSLGGTVPHTLDEAEELLQRMPEASESLAEMQQRMTESREGVLAARNQVNVTLEAVAALRKECARLEGQREQESWGNLSERLLADRTAIEAMRTEIASMAGQEGLPIPSFEPVAAEEGRHKALPLQGDRLNALVQFKTQVEEAIRATEREIAMLDGKLALLPELKAQVDTQQARLDALLLRKQAVESRLIVAPQAHQEQIEKARELQATLRDALRALQDALRERVQKLGVSFGQAAINTAESAARQQLESLQMTLGRRVELESRHASYAELLDHRQASLSEYYAQLAKLSGPLGGWIIPPSPFAEDLAAVRRRCQSEMREVNEEEIVRQIEALAIQEGASRAKIALCRAEIEAAQERIATQLAQRNRPSVRSQDGSGSFRLSDVVAVWPLVGEYEPQDRERLQREAMEIEQQLHEVEEQEMRLSGELATGAHIDLESARTRMEQQERVYETKKRGSVLVQAAEDRLLRKMLPRTEYFLQQLLPPLTRSRFHDARLTSVPDEAGEADALGLALGSGRGAWQLSVWEPRISDYLPISAFSAGTADLLSLALRLAFAIAALPHELGMAPGFLLLDEPLGASDTERARALVELVTGPLLSAHFEQIVLVSHSETWNPALFPYRVFMEAGEVVESNLPEMPAEVAEEVRREAVVEEWMARALH